jgi:hypothetical protein
MLFASTSNACLGFAIGTDSNGSVNFRWWDKLVAASSGTVFWFLGLEFKDHKVVLPDEGAR